ncbi:MAG: Tfp pilus assembly protein FimT/FimU [Hyalangium sp.]|uniref:pilus assembly FimT family protein n=1 Tax=Hyalangium sp. TaxID=2028555 RepID=UPI003899B9A6
MPAYSRHRRGFTLIEVMTAVVIIIILAALAVSYMVYGMGKARMNNAVFDATAMINGAQLRALSHGVPHYVLIHQLPALNNRVRLQVLERPDSGPAPADWNALDLNLKSPQEALSYTHYKTDGTTEILNAPLRDEMVLGDGAGVSASGLAFLDLDSTRVPKPLPAPFSAIPMTTPTFTPTDKDKPTPSLLAGCNFCVTSAGHPYGLLRFNSDGTMQVLTGNAASGAVIAFAPNTTSEQGFQPKLLTVSAPAGATVVF